MSPSRIPFIVTLVFTLAAALATPDAGAQSRRDKANSDALQQRMAAAEKRYSEVLAGKGGDGDAALAEMQGLVAACAKQRGCALPVMLATYERLLKTNAASMDTDAADFDEADADLIDEGDLAAADVPEGASAGSLLSEDGQRFVRMVQFNPAVQAGIRRWLTDMRPALMDSYENYRYMQHLMSPSFKRNGLPEALLFGIMAKESNGKVHVGSRAGAVGPLQFMPATGRRFGLGTDGTGFDTRYDPRASADAAASYLNERMSQLGNSIELSLAGYNGGEGRASRVYRDTGGRSFWDYDVYNQFPAETKDYVPMVIAAAWLYLHPRDYGIRFPRVSARPATIRLARPTSIYELTVCLGNSGSRDGYMRALRNLNPRYEAESWIGAGNTLNATTRIASLYNRYCTHGKRADLARQLVASNVQSALVRVGPITSVPQQEAATVPAAAEQAPPAPREYRVQGGETLTSIARKFQCDTRQLAQANAIKAPRFNIRPGQRLKLEGCRG
jgi:membrane-bound lytic murein transglycosylase D